MEEYEQRLIAALVSEPQAIREKLRPADREQLDVLLDLVAEGGDERRLRAVTRAVAAHLRTALPDAERGAVGRRYTAASTAQAPHEALVAYISPGGAANPVGGTAGPAPHGGAGEGGAAPVPAPQRRWASARDRLLAEPALTAVDLRDAFGVDADGAELIRLWSREGVELLPAFQFDGEGRPRPLVLTINGLLGAALDPWGVADWWLGPNLWLDAVPATLLGVGLDDQLLAAAGAVGEED
ncbi:DUF3168 domain-containing protein [Streptomyces sp. NPDC058964]|uniref:DUF3168 domain-containing protein n=1 Tax=Streptomyces sp. NPDC058964 TaxID=3346681 RepID=UPI0036953F69